MADRIMEMIVPWPAISGAEQIDSFLYLVLQNDTANGIA